MLSSDDKCVHLSSVMGSPTYTVISSAFLSFVSGWWGCLNACLDGLGHLFGDELPSSNGNLLPKQRGHFFCGGFPIFDFIVRSTTPSF